MEKEKIETIDKEAVLIISEFLSLYVEHPAKAHQFYIKHREVIDVVFEWHERTKKDWERERYRAFWQGDEK